MFDFSPSLECPIKKEKKTIVFESNAFDICTVNCKEFGIIFKKLVYAHHDGEKLHITIVRVVSEKITYVS